jgi:nicotinate phosphoribosyltransferase
MRAGRRLAASPGLAQVRQHARAELARLPPALRGLTPAPTPYPVWVSAALAALRAEVDARLDRQVALDAAVATAHLL